MTPSHQQSLGFLDHSVEKSSVIDIPLHFLSSPAVAGFRINLPPRVPRTPIPIISILCRFLNWNQHVLPCPSLLIASSEGTKAIFLAACQSVEAVEKEGFEDAPVDLYLEEEDNDAFFNQCFSDNEFFPKERDSSNKNKWDDEDDNNQASQALWIDSDTIVNARNKLIRILKGEALIP